MKKNSQTTGINIYPKKPNPSPHQLQQPLAFQECCHYKFKNQKNNPTSFESLNYFNENQFKKIDKNIMSDSHCQKYMPCRKQFNEKNLKLNRILKSPRNRKSFLIQMKLSIYLVVTFMLLKDHNPQLVFIPKVIAIKQEIYQEYDEKDGQKSPVIQRHKIEEEVSFLKNMKIRQMNDKVNYTKDFDAQEKQQKQIQHHLFYNFQKNPFSYFDKDQQNNTFQNQKQSKKINQENQENLTIKQNIDIYKKINNQILKFEQLQIKDQQKNNQKLNLKLQQNQLQNDNQNDENFKLYKNQNKRQLQINCSIKVTPIIQPIDWWFRGNIYNSISQHYVGASGLNDWCQIKQYPFDSITQSIQVIQNYAQLFSVTDTNCVPSSCKFSSIDSFGGDYLTLDQISSQTDLTLDLSPNFGVKFVNKKNYQGSFKIFKMTCNFGGQEIESKAVIIDQQPFCSQFVSTKAQIEKQIPFNQVSPFIRIQNISTELFSNNNLINCPISACTISEQTECDTLNPSSETQIQQDSVKFTNPSIVQGKCSQFKIICNFGSSGFNQESEYVKTIQLPKDYCATKVSLITNPIDWWFRGNLYNSSPQRYVGAAVLNDWCQIKQNPFDQNSDSIQVTQDYKEIFNSIDPFCTPSRCWFSYIDDLFGGQLAQEQKNAQTDLTIDPSPNFGVKFVNKKDYLGSFKNFKMTCNFGGQEIESKAVIIDQQPFCSQFISTKAQADKQFPFNQVSPLIRIEQISTELFLNSNYKNCPISACTISEQSQCDQLTISQEAFINLDSVQFNNPFTDLGKCSQLKINCTFGSSGFNKESEYVKTIQLPKDYCATKVSLITNPIDWWFRGNLYNSSPQRYVGAAALNDWCQIKQYPFDQNTDSIQVIQDYKETFNGTDPFCVPSSCKFSYIDDLFGGYLTQEQINAQTDLTIDPSPNFGVKFVNKKNYLGSFKNFKMTCNFGGQEIESKEVIIDQQPFCSQFISTKAQSDKQIPFNKVSPLIRVQQISTELFSNSDLPNCPISACAISEQIECDSLTISSEASINSDSVMFNNPLIDSGKCSQFKMRCNFGSYGFKKESEYVKTIQLSQNYCATKVTLIQNAIDWWFRGNQYHTAEHFLGTSNQDNWNSVKQYLFDQIKELIQVIQDYRDLFSSTDPFCVPSSCWISYINDFFGGQLTQEQINLQIDLTIDPSPNFGVKFVNKKVFLGIFKNFKMTCNFGGKQIESKSVIIDQQPYCSIQVQKIAQIQNLISFNHVSPLVRIEQISTQLYSNGDSTSCPISTCIISEQTECDSQKSSSDAYINSDTVKFNNPSIVLGKCSQFKVRCNFGSSGFQKESDYIMTKQLPKNYCDAKVTLITKPINWKFRGNQYHPAEHFVGTTSLKNLNQVKQYPFDQINQSYKVFQDYKEFFTFTDSLCVPSICKFSFINEFFGGNLTQDQINAQTDLTIDPSPNFGVQIVNQKNIQGSFKQFIMMCNFGGLEIESNLVIIDQQPEFCSTILKPIQETINIVYNGLQYNSIVDGMNSAIEIPYEKDLTIFDRIPQLSTLYQNSDLTKCPISDCIISAQIECNDSITAKPLSEGFIDKSYPNTLKFNNSKQILEKCSKLKVNCKFGSANYQVESYWIITNQTKQIDQCLLNQISLLDKNKKQIKVKQQIINKKQYIFQKSQFLNLIKIQNGQCQLNYKLKQSSDQIDYVDYKDQKIQFDALYNIQIYISKAFIIQDLYIEIESILSGQKKCWI